MIVVWQQMRFTMAAPSPAASTLSPDSCCVGEEVCLCNVKVEIVYHTISVSEEFSLISPTCKTRMSLSFLFARSHWLPENWKMTVIHYECDAVSSMKSCRMLDRQF